MRRECRVHFPRYRLQRKSLVSDHAPRHVLHAGIANPWCRGKRSRHSRRMRNPQFMHLARGPWYAVDCVDTNTTIGIFMAILFIMNITLSLSVTKLFWFCKSATPWMFPPLDILLEYWIEHVTFGLLYVMFTFPTRIFYMGVPSFATDCPCGVWCRVLTTCLLYIGPLFGNLV